MSRLQLILEKDGHGKSYALDSVAMILKKVMTPTRKPTLNVCRLTIHSHKEGSSLPVIGSFKELLGK